MNDAFVLNPGLDLASWGERVMLGASVGGRAGFERGPWFWDFGLTRAFGAMPARAETWVWRKVSDALLPSGRTGHTATAQPGDAGVVIFGGGDNEGRWFDGATAIPYATLL